MFLETADCIAVNGTVVPFSSDTDVPADGADFGVGAAAFEAATGVAPFVEGAGADGLDTAGADVDATNEFYLLNLCLCLLRVYPQWADVHNKSGAGGLDSADVDPTNGFNGFIVDWFFAENVPLSTMKLLVLIRTPNMESICWSLSVLCPLDWGVLFSMSWWGR